MVNLTLIIGWCALPLLLYMPGRAFSRLFTATPDLLERHYERLAVGALWNGWLALLLAELGLFSLWLHLAITAALCVAAWPAGRRWGRDSTLIAPAPGWTLAYAAVALLALLPIVRPFEVVLGVRDAGVYANAGFAIARTGGIVQYDAVLAGLGQAALADDPAVREPAAQALSNFLISQPRDRYIATKLRAAGFLVNEGDAPAGRVTPQGLHLLPAWIGLLTSLGGRELGLFAPGLLGWLGLLSVGMLGRRLAGPWVGLTAMLLLGLNGVQVWFSRYSTAETAAQFLIWAGLYFFVRAEQTRNDPPVRHFSLLHSHFSLLTGIAIGQVAFARLDFFLLAPLALLLAYRWFTRRWHHADTALTLGLGLMLLHAGLHSLLIARAYVLDTGFARFQDWALISLALLPFLTPPLREAYLSSKFSTLDDPLRLGLELVVVVALFGGLFFLRRRSVQLGDASPLRRVEQWLVQRRAGLARLSAALIVLLAAYAYLVRPQIIDADLLFNLRGGWNDPLTRDAALVQADVNQGRMTVDEARLMAGVVLSAEPAWKAAVDQAATTALRARLAAERGPWQGPFSNQSFNWLRLQGYVGAPIRLPIVLWYNEYAEMNWWQRIMVDPAGLSSTPEPIRAKYLVPLANFVRVGWYLSPLGMLIGVAGYALWWRRAIAGPAWLFLVVALIGTFFYVRQTFGTSDQTYIYILRRFIPITYPALCLGIAYGLAALAEQGRWQFARRGLAFGLAGLLVLFLAYTNRPIFAHTEYGGALRQLEAIAGRFEAGRDILLLRGGGPRYSQYRDVPDMLATPLRFAFGLDAFTVKSSQPGAYADQLAAQVRRWQAEGRQVYTLLSASGAGFVLPGFDLEPLGQVTLELAEFEALTDQKPRNVSQLSLPFAVYRLASGPAGQLATAPFPLGAADFAAQVNGFYRPESGLPAGPYAWTDGLALVRLAWPSGTATREFELQLAGGERPAQLGAARLCLAARPETRPWPLEDGAGPFTPLGCYELGETMAGYRVRLDPALLPPAASGSLLLQLESAAWVPAAEDPRQRDRRAVGVQFGGIELVE